MATASLEVWPARAETGRLQKRAGLAARWVVVLLLIAVGAMASARYL